MTLLPQEIQVWYVIPALRREIASMLIKKHGLSQKKVAAILGISEGAVSQYLNSKRGINVQFNEEATKEIAKAANSITRNEEAAMKELIKLSEMESIKRTVCNIHLEQDPNLKKNCNICFS